MRENVIRFHVAGWSNAYISTFFHGRPCERTVRDWVQRYSQAPLLGAPAPLPIPFQPTQGSSDVPVGAENNGNEYLSIIFGSWKMWPENFG